MLPAVFFDVGHRLSSRCDWCSMNRLVHHGFAPMIRILQELLRDEPSNPENLDERTIGELSEILTDLQERLRSRES